MSEVDDEKEKKKKTRLLNYLLFIESIEAYD